MCVAESASLVVTSHNSHLRLRYSLLYVCVFCDAVGGGTRLQHPVATLMCQCLGCRERIEDGKYFALKASSSELHQTCRPVLVHMYEPNPQL